MDSKLLEIKNEIYELEVEVKLLEEKKERLSDLKEKYYKEYFMAPRDEFSQLTNIPQNVTDRYHILSDFSNLKIDVIGQLICELFKKYENKDVVAKKLYHEVVAHTAIPSWQYEPVLLIGSGEDIEDLGTIFYSLPRDSDNILIGYNYDDSSDFIMKKKKDQINSFVYSIPYNEYNKLIDKDLVFDDKDHGFIRELIYSLAYYQKQHNINYMSAKETRHVYQKIYKK